MAEVSTSRLKEGMTTQSEVVDKHGHTLIRANEEITNNHITLLKMWGVSSVTVKDSVKELDLEQLKAVYSTSIIDDLALSADTKLRFIHQDNQIYSFLKKTFIEAEAKRSK